jgi:hypothetical protein
MAFLIIFDIKDDATRKNFINAIAHCGDCIPLSELAYAVKADQPLRQVYDSLRLHLGAKDQLIVVPLVKPYNGGNERVKRWLDENLSE